MVFNGHYFLKNSAKKYDLKLWAEDSELKVQAENFEKILIQGECIVSTLIVGQPIVIESDARYEFKYDELLADYLVRNSYVARGFAFDLEKSFKRIILGLLAISLIIFLFFKVALPFGSVYIAKMLPKSMLSKIDSLVLNQLDSYVFDKSEVSEERKGEIKSLFRKYYFKDYKIHFRKGKSMRANAFALVDNTIIITDELIDLLRKDEYILSVLFHEAGHLVNKDSASKLVSDSFLSLMSLLFLGDVSGTAAVIVNIGLASQVSKYSQEKEIRADRFALNNMDREGIPATCFTESLKLLSAYYNNGNSNMLIDSLSSHPKVEKRVKKILEGRENIKPCL